MKTIQFQVTFTGRVNDEQAKAIQRAWDRSETVADIPIREVALLSSNQVNAHAIKFDFCQPNALEIR
jgi:hypothetical protein